MASGKRTVLFDTHRRLGAKMTEFAGFEMPVSYGGIISEHLAVRATAGWFDLSHMGEFEVSGSAALGFLERALTNSAVRLGEGQAQYSLICDRTGGVIDDVIVYRTGPARYMLCVNASNIASDLQWLTDLGSSKAALRDLSDETALIAIQGPSSAGILKKLCTFTIDAIVRFGVVAGEIAGIPCLIARTGYTGEDGFELFTSVTCAVRLCESLIELGAAAAVVPCGLGARDTLRLEAGLPLYGHELDRETSPLEAGLAGFVKLGRHFVGSAALEAEKTTGMRKNLIGLRSDDGKTIARQGYRIFQEGHLAGVVTSGTFAPTIGHPVAMAYMSGACPEVGTRLAVEVRNRLVPARTVKLPFYRRPRTGPAATIAK
jgi:aminomethyltransferase